MTSLYLFALVAGAWWLQQQTVLPDLTGAMALVPLAVGRFLLAHRAGAPGRALAHAVALVAFAGTGFFWAAAIGSWKLADALTLAWEGRDIEISGVIAEMVQPNDRGMRFVFDVEKISPPDAQIPSRIALMWYDNAAGAPAGLQAGQRWHIAARLHRPHGNANPAGFDFEAWMLERGIRAVGYVRAQPSPRLIKAFVPRPGYLVERLRESTRAHLFAVLHERPYAGVIAALAIGDQQAIPAAQWQVFTRTGVNHLMSISGLHITMVASMMFLLVLRLWRASESLVLRLPAVRAATACAVLVALCYATLSGFAVPAQRTVYMLAVVGLALWTGWTARSVSILAVAAALVVMVDPMAVIAPGFWLSFGAVAVIIFAAGSRIGKPEWWRAWVHTQWAVTLALVPLLLAVFQQVSLVSPVANAFAIPLVSLIVVPLALAASIIPVDGIAHAAHLMMAGCMAVLRVLAELPDAVWEQHAPAAWAVPVALAGAFWMLLPRGFPARWVGAMLMLPLFLAVPIKPLPGELHITVLDVGQGLAVVLRTREHVVLYDAGPAYSEQLDAGGRIIIPYLRAAGVGSLDVMIISHDDNDHSGGALSVMQGMPVAALATSLPQGHALRGTIGNSGSCVAGTRWEWDGVAFEFLHPRSADYNDPRTKDNDRSCVLRVVSPYGSVLLPGDIERVSELRIVQSAAILRSDLLIAPHHGSRTSSTDAFVQAISPHLTVFSVGYRNRFGHPHHMVSARYRNAGSRTLRTDVTGALLIAMTAEGIQAQGWREVESRYWAGR